MTPAPVSRRDALIDDSVAALRMVIAQLREFEVASPRMSHDGNEFGSSHERSDRH